MARKQGSHSEITGPRVRDAALKLFARHGYAAVSMRQIAAEVGVQAGALYNYTPDKQSLLFELMRSHMDDLLAAQEKAAVSGTAMVQLEAFTRFHIHYHLERPDLVFISYMELRNLSPENFADLQKQRKTYETSLESILRLGVDSKEFNVADPQITSFALIAMLTGPSNWYRDEGRLPQERLADLYWDMVKRAVT